MTIKITEIYIDGAVMNFRWRTQAEYDLGIAFLEKLTGGKQISASGEVDFFYLENRDQMKAFSAFRRELYQDSGL